MKIIFVSGIENTNVFPAFCTVAVISIENGATKVCVQISLPFSSSKATLNGTDSSLRVETEIVKNLQLKSFQNNANI